MIVLSRYLGKIVTHISLKLDDFIVGAQALATNIMPDVVKGVG
jgi:hypothetical protein